MSELRRQSTETADGWVIEVGAPLPIVPGTELVAGGKVGFNVSVVDSDGGVWNRLLWLGNQEVDTAQWGSLALSRDTLAVDAAGKPATAWGDLRS